MISNVELNCLAGAHVVSNGNGSECLVHPGDIANKKVSKFKGILVLVNDASDLKTALKTSLFSCGECLE